MSLYLTNFTWKKLLRVTEFIFSSFFFNCQRYKPDLIRGDMDSIRPEVKEFYSNLVDSLFKYCCIIFVDILSSEYLIDMEVCYLVLLLHK